MHNPRHTHAPAVRDGVGPSCVVLPSQGQGSMLDFLARRLPAVAREEWLRRMQAGDVVDERGDPVAPARPFEGGLRLYYYRSLPAEPALPFTETVLYQDEHLVVADKPHFMPVTPSGRYLHNTLLVRLKRQLGLPELSPLHRIDRDTAGLVLLSVHQRTRGAYQALFRDRQITKHYDAIAPWRADVAFPREHISRLEESPQFFRMQEVPGEPNSHTRIEVLDVAGASGWARYRLSPVTGKRHQLRVHMAALGLPLRNDPFYPVVNDPPEGDYSRPLQLLARSLEFVDPLSGARRVFESGQRLGLP
ncbi:MULTISPECIES: pseudouridine synthase [unclassified Acidovorax]|uniref:pseudouridine synthase n=1 Tax=unclassified Acidovorax TaxID=2684926 RepID=UPI001C4733E2|nr:MULTISPECIES: pseudouridine synthase [unclassified Acidovorax]MBV7426878.1 pseudouridine synthase [Acidovorax sp. sif0732]MBV7448003.1 pseudouridine synthase [Acidovorax sp. sif0715]